MSVAQSERLRTIGRRTCFVVAMLFFLIGVLPVGSWMLLPLENSLEPQKPEHVAGIIMLGGDEKPHSENSATRPIFLDSGRRFIGFATLARQYPNAKLVYSGGTSLIVPEANTSDADVAKQVLAGLGVPVDKMVFEGLSRNTRENATMSADLVHPQPEQTWLLVTSAFHMPRALLTFRKAGWNVVPAPTGYLTSGDFSTRLQFNLGEHLMEMAWAGHEYFGLLAYRLMGYTDSLWPN